MPKRFTPRERKIIYDFLVQRDGPRCMGCQKPEEEVELVINHKDGDRKNNHPDNLDLRCRRCNLEWMVKMNLQGTGVRPSGVSVDESVKVGVRVGRALKVDEEPPEMRVNREKEPLWRAWVLGRIIEGPPVQIWEAVDGGAEKYDVSQITVGRWLKKMLSPQGPLRLSEGRRGFQFLWLKEGALGLAAGSSTGKIPEDKQR